MSGLVTAKRPSDPIWIAIAAWIVLFVALMATGHGQEVSQENSAPKPRIVHVGASWCPPCKVQSRDIVPELRKRGYEVLEYDSDSLNVLRLFPTPTVPAWFVIGDPVYANTADDVLDRLCIRPAPRVDSFGHVIDLGRVGQPSGDPPRTPARDGGSRDARPHPTKPDPVARNPPDLVALFRDNLGERASFELSLTDERTIEINGTTVIKLPKIVQCDVDGREPRTLKITFGTPVPTAETKKLGATISADIPEVRITGNTITATANVGLGIQRDFIIEVKRLPWDE